MRLSQKEAMIYSIYICDKDNYPFFSREIRGEIAEINTASLYFKYKPYRSARLDEFVIFFVRKVGFVGIGKVVAESINLRRIKRCDNVDYKSEYEKILINRNALNKSWRFSKKFVRNWAILKCKRLKNKMLGNNNAPIYCRRRIVFCNKIFVPINTLQKYKNKFSFDYLLRDDRLNGFVGCYGYLRYEELEKLYYLNIKREMR